LNTSLDTALEYARRGWAVFPCRPGSKEPATAHGFNDASTDQARIERIWSRHPDMNVAIATGGTGPDVLDVDVAHGKPGYDSLSDAVRAGLVTTPMGLVLTPSGGLHLYYQGDAQRNGSLPDHGLDLRGEGGYVLAPPSQVKDTPYLTISAWKSEPVPVDFGRIRQHFEPERQSVWAADRAGPRTARHLARWVAGQREGNRNQATFWAACRAAELGDSEALAAIAEAAVSTGLPRRSVDKTIASAVRTVLHPPAAVPLRPRSNRQLEAE
jgi:Bifunctional DNA primase/polymerase, N-terminal